MNRHNSRGGQLTSAHPQHRGAVHSSTGLVQFPHPSPRYQDDHAPIQMHHHHHPMIPNTGAAQGLHHHNQPPQIGGAGGGGGAAAGAAAFMRQGIQDGGVVDHFPLRILVQSDMVGAIIGRAGSTIRQITQQSKARIDVHREESVDQQEKIITINGSPESCSAACFRIIEVILNEKQQQALNKMHDCSVNNLETTNNQVAMDAKQQDATNMDPSRGPEIQLKILAHNNLIGRLIGKNGASIKKIMERTSTRINISVNSLADCTNERTITVVGNLEQVRQAEQVISNKLRAAYMSDMSITLQAMNQQPYLFNNVPISYMPGHPYTQNPILSSIVNSQAGHGGHAIPRAMPVGSHQSQITGSPLYPNSPSYLSLYPNINVPPSGHGLLGFNPSMTGLETERETVNIYIPSSMVGAIIGKSGSAIKEMISTSGASIKVAAAPAHSESISAAGVSKEENSTLQRQQTKSNFVNDSNSNEEIPPPESKPEDPQSSVVTSQAPQLASRQPGNSDYYSATRKVTIVGTPESQWSAQYLIFRKVSIENGKSDVSLMVEIQVPSQVVGKIIGKGGATVKQIQKQTRTTIRLPDEKSSSLDNEKNGSETCVQITGEFQNSQLAQRHIKHLIRESLYLSSRQNKPQQQSKYNESNSSRSNAQANFNDNHQHRSDNGSSPTPDDEVYNESSSRSNEKSSSVDDDKHQSPAQDESLSNNGQTKRPNECESQSASPQDSETGNGDKVNDNSMISNNNTSNKNLNSTEAPTDQAPVKMKDHLSDDIRDNQDDGCQNVDNGQVNNFNSCAKQKSSVIESSRTEPALVNNGNAK